VTIRIIVAVFALQGTSAAGTILLQLGRDILLAGFLIAAGVTLLFAVWEYLEFKFRYSERWKPESLRPVPPPNRQLQKLRPLVRVTGGIVWLTFFALALYSPWFFWVWGGRGVFGPSEALYAMRFPLWLLALFGISQSWLTYTRFATARWRQFLRAGVIVAGVVLAIFLLRTGDLLVAGPNWDPTQGKSLATLNQMFAGVLVLACIIFGLGCLRELFRVVRHLGSHP
jgi:hypothetical protein